MANKTLLISIDMDSLSEYVAIYGIKNVILPSNHKHIMYEKALARFHQFCQTLHLNATIFVVGQDIEYQLTKDLLKDFAKAGYEISNHSYHHHYNLSSLSTNEIQKEIITCHEQLTNIGITPHGFRAPGYHTSARLLQCVTDMGYIYDSSKLASLLYFGLKASILQFYKLTGKASKSYLGSWSDFKSPQTPHPLNNHCVELPISSIMPIGIPLTGSFIGRLPAQLLALFTQSLRYQSFVHIEFHAIDFLHECHDQLPPELVMKLPELKIPYDQRIKKFTQIIKGILPRTSLSLHEAAKQRH